MANEVAVQESAISKVILKGDLSALSETELINYYKTFCERLGLDWATNPFKLIKLNGKLVMYADRGATQQLSKKHSISHKITAREQIGEGTDTIYVVSCCAYAGDRQTESIGAVPIGGLRGEALANALMKAETKSKRRSTLDFVGLGMLDETEVTTIPGAQMVEINTNADQRQAEREKSASEAAGRQKALPSTSVPMPSIVPGWREVKSHIGNKSGNVRDRKLGTLDVTTLTSLCEVLERKSSLTEQDSHLLDAVQTGLKELQPKGKKVEADDIPFDSAPDVSAKEAFLKKVADLPKGVLPVLMKKLEDEWWLTGPLSEIGEKEAEKILASWTTLLDSTKEGA